MTEDGRKIEGQAEKSTMNSGMPRLGQPRRVMMTPVAPTQKPRQTVGQASARLST